MSLPIEMLPASERVQILKARLANLKAGAGDYRPSSRTRAIQNAEKFLAQAEADLVHAMRRAN